MAVFSHARFLIIASGIACLSACTVRPPTDVGGRINTFVQTASGIVQDATHAAAGIQNRAQAAQKGVKELESGATLLQNSLKP